MSVRVKFALLGLLTAQPLANHTENAIELVRMIWGFITKEADECGYAFSETVSVLCDLLFN